MTKLLLTLCAPLLIAGCATTPIVDAGPPLPAGSAVALGEAVSVANIALTPMRVTEDSRCPINARCVWAGRIVVETRVDGPGWRETVPLTLGEPAGVRGYILNLISAEPGQLAGGPAPKPADYRFAFEGWPPGRPPE
ncbi:hypothetical protein [Alteraurantiacibacter palmitatis]|uniref:Lipoprotein n=1 Tax=Alteraurantiacibacter palmitatis TaxID=2054628 RepID=A0ABV7E4H6_9SPHN